MVFENNVTTLGTRVQSTDLGGGSSGAAKPGGSRSSGPLNPRVRWFASAILVTGER